jgi:hypothetical protein
LKLFLLFILEVKMFEVSEEMILEVWELMDDDRVSLAEASKTVAKKYGLGDDEAAAIAGECGEIKGMLESCSVALDSFLEKNGKAYR